VGHVSPFLQLFSSLSSRELNRFYERDGHFWAGRARVEEILDDSSAEMMLMYDACNPVKDGMVERARQWKGFSTNEALARGKRLEYSYFNRTGWWKAGGETGKSQKSDFIEKVVIEMTPLPSWSGMKDSQRQTRFRKMIEGEEERARTTRSAEGRTVYGEESLAKRNPFERPSKPRVRTSQKYCHADTQAACKAYKDMYRELKRAHMQASGDFRSGFVDVEFPPGTFRPPLTAVATMTAS